MLFFKLGGCPGQSSTFWQVENTDLFEDAFWSRTFLFHSLSLLFFSNLSLCDCQIVILGITDPTSRVVWQMKIELYGEQTQKIGAAQPNMSVSLCVCVCVCVCVSESRNPQKK